MLFNGNLQQQKDGDFEVLVCSPKRKEEKRRENRKRPPWDIEYGKDNKIELTHMHI